MDVKIKREPHVGNQSYFICVLCMISKHTIKNKREINIYKNEIVVIKFQIKIINNLNLL